MKSSEFFAHAERGAVEMQAALVVSLTLYIEQDYSDTGKFILAAGKGSMQHAYDSRVVESTRGD
jgi:hypothetical protein